jgi:serine/threonine-protein kinase HipA
MAICLGCLQEKRLKKDYCTKCINEIFDGKIPKTLDFNKKDFYTKRIQLAPRFSISGVQDKLSLKFEDDRLVPTDKDGRYILKPIPSNSNYNNPDDIVANEHLSINISLYIFKIDSAKSALIRFSDNEFAYITKRFDYLDDSTKYDQEDFASILDVNSVKDGDDYKYSARSYYDCAVAIKRVVPTYQIALEDFFKRVLLNYLISNADAHLKNFSLYSPPYNDDYRLTPNYDILNIRLHINEMFGDMAMDFMPEDTPAFDAIGYYTYDDFYAFAKLLNITDKRFNKIIDLANNSKEKVINLTKNSMLSDQAKEEYINSYCKRLDNINYKYKNN